MTIEYYVKSPSHSTYAIKHCPLFRVQFTCYVICNVSGSLTEKNASLIYLVGSLQLKKEVCVELIRNCQKHFQTLDITVKQSQTVKDNRTCRESESLNKYNKTQYTFSGTIHLFFIMRIKNKYDVQYELSFSSNLQLIYFPVHIIYKIFSSLFILPSIFVRFLISICIKIMSAI